MELDDSVVEKIRDFVNKLKEQETYDQKMMFFLKSLREIINTREKNTRKNVTKRTNLIISISINMKNHMEIFPSGTTRINGYKIPLKKSEEKQEEDKTTDIDEIIINLVREARVWISNNIRIGEISKEDVDRIRNHLISSYIIPKSIIPYSNEFYEIIDSAIKIITDEKKE